MDAYTSGPWKPQTSPHHAGLWETIDKRNNNLGPQFYNLDHATAWCNEANAYVLKDAERQANMNQLNQQQLADAALIAAAPELLQALRCALADLEGALQAHFDGDPHGHDWKAHALSIDEARAAISKATGDAS